MVAISFRAKAEQVYNPEDDSPAYQIIRVPVIKRSHCDMNYFRTHKKHGGFANSDMFPLVLARLLRDAGVPKVLRLDQLPECVTVDNSSFLARVDIQV